MKNFRKQTKSWEWSDSFCSMSGLLEESLTSKWDCSLFLILQPLLEISPYWIQICKGLTFHVGFLWALGRGTLSILICYECFTTVNYLFVYLLFCVLSFSASYLFPSETNCYRINGIYPTQWKHKSTCSHGYFLSSPSSSNSLKRLKTDTRVSKTHMDKKPGGWGRGGYGEGEPEASTPTHFHFHQWSFFWHKRLLLGEEWVMGNV